MKLVAISISTAAVIFCGCSIRLVGIVETEDAIYGKASVTKEQKYDPKHLGFLESIMGTFNSDSIKAIGGIIAGEQARPEPTPAPPPVVTPLTPGAPVIVQP